MCSEHIITAFMTLHYGIWIVILSNSHVPHSGNVYLKYDGFIPWVTLSSSHCCRIVNQWRLVFKKDFVDMLRTYSRMIHHRSVENYRFDCRKQSYIRFCSNYYESICHSNFQWVKVRANLYNAWLARVFIFHYDIFSFAKYYCDLALLCSEISFTIVVLSSH